MPRTTGRTPQRTAADPALAETLKADTPPNNNGDKRVGKNEDKPGLEEQIWFVESINERYHMAYIGREGMKLRFYLGRSSFHPKYANNMKALIGKRFKLTSLGGPLLSAPEHYPREVRKVETVEDIDAKIKKLMADKKRLEGNN